MFSIKDLSNYKENNRIEAKKAETALPRSIWETYSAFANSLGGVILLGVTENNDKTFNMSGVENAEKVLQDFWNNINNQKVVSVNILTDRNAQIIEISKNKKVIKIDVPRADRRNKPVYVGENPLTGSFRRNGEGDYHCTKYEVKNMISDSLDSSSDMLVLTQFDDFKTAFDMGTVMRYKTRLSNLKPNHVWNDIPVDELLLKIGALVKDNETGRVHPTAAGILMFGYEYEIVREFPNYFLDYREKLDETTRWSDRVVSNLGEWSGNLYDFYFKIYARVTGEVKTPFKLKNGFDRIDDTPMHEAIREAVTNALVHSNYYERRGLVIEKSFKEIIISNPGSMRISVDEAVSGGVSDTRNQTLMKMFALILIGERAGSGLYGIHSVWEENGLNPPVMVEQFNPDRVVLKLQINIEKSSVDKNNTQDTHMDTPTDTHTDTPTDKIVSLLEFCATPRSRAEIQSFLNLKDKIHFLKTYLNPLLENGKIAMTIPDKPTSKNQKYFAVK